ncbi:MAG: helix-turn-helix transcriptional regulator [Oscillibacter sp.]|nr:helix-turn-helix transcriptional regulator [Oscillibacter sp.]
MKHTENILRIIEERKITSYKLAKETGISESLFSKWRENPSSKIRSEILVLIADYLDCSVDYLLGRTENPEINKQPKE